MRPLSLRGRLAASFAAAVGLALLLFSVAVVVVLGVDEGERAAAGAADNREDVRQVLGAMVLVAPLAMGGAAAAGLSLARRALKPLREASVRARAASHSPLELELPITGRGDEWDELATTINGMLASSRDSVARVRRFTADAAHELRTPLTTIVGEADLALRRDRTAEDLRVALAVIHSEGLRLREVVTRLLALARADAGALRLHPRKIALHDRMESALERARRTAAQLGRQIDLEAATDRVEVTADPELLDRAVDNLLENAIQHGGTHARLVVRVRDGFASIEVADNGPGVPASLRPRLFERFATADASRSGGGTGLGLALAKAIAEAHHGSLHYLDGPGARFRLELPMLAVTGGEPEPVSEKV